ncbi:MAG: hypothetical protein QOJ51_2782, partial [Acidobacteriaceae bacterium]|nr:hypothetical protein [Acidobacteriaceae bacterium]
RPALSVTSSNVPSAFDGRGGWSLWDHSSAVSYPVRLDRSGLRLWRRKYPAAHRCHNRTGLRLNPWSRSGISLQYGRPALKMNSACRRDIDELARRCGGSRVRIAPFLGLANPTAQQYSRHAPGAEPQQNALPHPHLILLMKRPAQPEPGTLRSNLHQCIRVLVSY